MQLRVPLSSPTITRELFERKLGKKKSELVNQMLITVVFEKPTVPPMMKLNSMLMKNQSCGTINLAF